jgi:hypothetical protein
LVCVHTDTYIRLQLYPSDEDIVDSHGEITNIEKFMKLVENVNHGREDKIRVVRYTTEGDPIKGDHP